jgi:hypothetical protein
MVSGALDGQVYTGAYDAFLVKFNRNGVRQWTRLWGTSGDEIPRSVAVDTSGNIYVAGYTEGALDGQPLLGGSEAFLTKWSENGTKAWTRTWGTSGDEDANAVTTDALGNIYVAGETNGVLPGQVSAGERDAFLVRFDTLGNRTLTRQWGTLYRDAGLAVAHDGVGALYVTGYRVVDAAGLDSSVVLTKLNPGTGDLVWERVLGVAGVHDRGQGVVTLGTTDVFIVGTTAGALDGQTSSGSNDLFVSRYNAAGDRLWTRQRGSTSGDMGVGLVAAPAGLITAIGLVGGVLDGQPHAGGNDFAALRFDLDGNHQWTRTFGTSGTDNASAIAADAVGHVWIAGTTNGTLNGRTNLGSYDAFLLFIP